MASFYLLGNATGSQMFGCVIQTQNKTIVIDGGTVGDCQQLADFLKEKADSHVDAWFFTHPHHDHIGAFCQLTEEYPKIQIDGIYHHFPALALLKQYGNCSEWEILLCEQMYKFLERNDMSCVQKIEPGNQFCFDDVVITVLRVFKESISENFINNSSTVFRVESTEKSFLILGDLGEEGGEDVVQNCKLELLQTDYTQMAHHGQAGVSRAFYEYIRPKRCLWTAPDWLWNNDAGDGFDTGPWKTVRTREWVAALGVTEHYVEKDGLQIIEF